MDNYYELLKTARLFSGINEKDMSALLSCLGAKIIPLAKDEFALMAGDKVNHIGIVLIGRVHIIKEDKNGERVTIRSLSAGESFAEALCCTEVSESPVSVIANMNSIIMNLDYRRILHTCRNSCAFHTTLIENMVFVIAEKNLMLQNRMNIISKKTVRMKTLTYLEFISERQGYNIKIPFNREQLAEYLCVDRSALSHELARMKKDGLIDYHKNKFKLLT